MQLPGSPISLMPPGEDWLIRRVQELERDVREMIAAFQRIGLIENSALASPVWPATASGEEGFDVGFTLTALWVSHAPASVTVPDGYTQCLVSAVSAVRIGDGTSAPTVGIRASIAGIPGPQTSFGADAGKAVMGSATASQILTGLASGATVTVATDLRVNAGDPFCAASTVGTFLFIR